MIVLVLVLLLLTVALVLLLVHQARTSDTTTETWARSHGLGLTDETRPIVSLYLRNSRDLRQLGAAGALFIAAAVTAGTGLDLHVPGLVWILCGYVTGCLWAELTLAHVPSTGVRSASLVTRRLRDYLPAPMVAAEVALPIVAGALSIVSFVADPSARPNDSIQLFVVGSPEVMRQGAVATGAVAVALMIAVAVGQRLLLRRPQPQCPPDELAVDDAMRSSSIHLVGAAGLVVADLTAAQQLGYLSNLVSGPMQTALILGAVASVLAGLLMWQRWAHRRWPTRRRAAIADDPPDVPVDRLAATARGATTRSGAGDG